MKTFTNKKNQIVGWLDERIYRKVVDSRKHKMKVYDGYGIDKRIINSLNKECDEVRLKEKDTGNIYAVSFTELLEKGIEKDFGFGEQVFLPLRYWKKQNDNYQNTVAVG